MHYTYEVEVALDLLQALDCPRSLTVALMLRFKEYDAIVSLRARPDDYEDSQSFFTAYQATRLLQKSSWLPVTVDKKAAALETFWKAESCNRETNEFFKGVMSGNASFASSGVRKTLSRARRKVHSLLRGTSPFRFLDFCGFGPGADSGTRGGFTAAYDKLSAPGQVTRGASQFVDFLVQNSSLCTGPFVWDATTRSINIERVNGNRTTFVPKDCKTLRTIAVEPRWNIFLQKGMGKVLRSILQRKAGIDLDDQSRNQYLAFVGASQGTLSTIDLQSASDTVSYQLIAYLFPKSWFHVLDRLRSHYFLLNKEWYKAEKWSSMGNGYTFELESLVFHSLCWAVCGDDHSVYGDDLVVPVKHYSEIVELLRVCGFTTNPNKSFHTGNFRESCGSDFFGTRNVTPIYWKEHLDVEGTIRLVNQISVLARRFRADHFRDRRFRRVWERLVNRLPASRRFFGPECLSSVVHAPLGEWAKVARYGWCGWELKAPVFTSVKFRYKEYPTAILTQWFQPSTDGYSVRDRVRLTYKTVFIPTDFIHRNGDIGTWV